MADMHKIQTLINTFHDISKKDAKDVLQIAQEAEDTLTFGIVAIGNLMYHAAENKSYDEKSLKSDMFSIGLLLRSLGSLQAAVSTTIGNCKYQLNETEDTD